MTVPTDVVNGGGLFGSRKDSKTDSKSSKSEKSKEKRRSSSEDYFKYDSCYDDSKYNDPYVSQKSTQV